MTIFKNNKLLIATGGTGGHVFPAYSLAKNLIKNDYEVEIVLDQRGFKFLEKYKNIKLIINNSTTIFKKKFFNTIFSSKPFFLIFLIFILEKVKIKSFK